MGRNPALSTCYVCTRCFLSTISFNHHKTVRGQCYHSHCTDENSDHTEGRELVSRLITVTRKPIFLFPLRKTNQTDELELISEGPTLFIYYTEQKHNKGKIFEETVLETCNREPGRRHATVNRRS